MDVVDDPLSKKVITFTNGWVSETNGTMNGKTVGVGVGSLTDDPEQGVVLVREFDEKRALISTVQVLTPEKVGPVKIVDYGGMKLTLAAEGGQQFIFNVAAKKFVEREQE
ncbi:MAG: hypothetical protein H0Z34_02890 [Brevibacillus sp.]|nr:hypothetical protein [Brevibacillus sp.]